MTPWYIYVAIPLITAVIGYVTNWAAIKMIFWPEHFVGIGPLGWQGVLPRRADKFAADVAETMTAEVMSTRELADRLDPASLSDAFEDIMDDRAQQMVGAVADSIRPGLWDEMAEPAREAVVHQIKADAAATGEEIFARLESETDDILDLKALVVSLLSGDNTHRLVQLFQEIGGKELRFIVNSGAVFGLVIGLAQAAAYGFLDRWWLMPIIGALVGLVTNWLAIQMIFRPREPRKWLFGYQGLFAKRQAAIAHDYGRVAAEEILTPANLIRFVTEGEAGVRLVKVVLGVISDRVDQDLPKLAPFLNEEVTPELLSKVKWVVTQQIGVALPEVEDELEARLSERLDIANTVESKLAAMPKQDFERILRGIFEQDEWILIVIGGALGFGVGWLQGLLVLSTTI